MSNYVYCQTQVTTIMEILTKSAIGEIRKLFDDSSALLCLKIYRSLNENEALKTMMERELRTARGREEGREGARRSSVNTRSVGIQVFVEEQCRESVFEQEWSFRLKRDGEPTEESADMEEVRPESLLIKQEGLEEDSPPTPVVEEQVTQPTHAGGPEEQVAQCTPVEEGKKQETVPTPAGDPEELSEQHRCGHSDEELSGLEFAVKAEQEEEHVAQRPNQTGCEHSAGRLNNLGSEYAMYEKDSQLWTSFTQGDSDIETDDPVCLNTTEQYSHSLSVPTELQHAPATVEGSGSTLSSFGASYDEVFDKMSGKQPVYGEELRSEAIHTQQGQYRERPVDTVEREDQTLLPQKQQHGPTVRQMRGGESTAQSHSGSQYEASYTLSAGTFNTGKKMKTLMTFGIREKLLNCSHCGKAFEHCSQLEMHQRSHTGEKPYRCTQCGKRFSKRCNLITHQRIHTGEKPFGCVHCGMRFAQQANLRTHQRIHTGEKPFNCSQCGKCFTQSSSLKTHQRVHSRNKPI